MTLPILGSVVHGISTTLAHLDTEGRTLDPRRRPTLPGTSAPA